MMRICVDDRISMMDPGDTLRLGDVVQGVLSELPPNRVISGICLNGSPVPKHRERAALQRRLREVQDLQIRTADVSLYARHGLDTALDSLEQLARSLVHAAGVFRSGNTAEAVRYFHHCLEGLERFLGIVSITKSVMGLDFQNVVLGDVTLAQVETHYANILLAMEENQKLQDYEMVADRIEFGLLPNLGLWRKGLGRLNESQDQ